MNQLQDLLQAANGGPVTGDPVRLGASLQLNVIEPLADAVAVDQGDEARLKFYAALATALLVQSAHVLGRDVVAKMVEGGMRIVDEELSGLPVSTEVH